MVPHNETGRKLQTACLPIQEKTNAASVAHPGFLGNDASGHSACKLLVVNVALYKKPD